MKEKNNFYIITGAPGTGKSTLISLLANNFLTVEEPARRVIKTEREKNGDGLWDKNRERFLNLMLNYSKSSYKDLESNNITFFDRGLPDLMAYADYANLNVDSFERAARELRYNKKVFILLPWEEIYQNDEERKMSFNETKLFHNLITKAYQMLNYDLIEVPKYAIQERLDFILKSINK